MEPQDFLITRGQQETMTSPQLREYIDKQKQRGFANIKVFEVEYYRRIATSFAAFILTVIGLSLSSQKRKGGMGLHLGYRNVIVVKKMTFPNDKLLTIEMTEQQISGRNISLNIDYEDVLSADSFNTALLEEE